MPVNNLIRIRGYSDHELISNEIYLSNWELSGMRAFSVLHALSDAGISENRLVVEAYGRFSPVINENNRVDPLKSRRVVIAISKYAVVTVEKNSELTEDKSIKNSSAAQSTLPKEDSKEMREVYLPNNRLIITTRQE
jgi:chemotaxis protein MotB